MVLKGFSYYLLKGGTGISPVAETGFSHTLTAYKIVGQFFGLSYKKISGNNQVKDFRISNIQFNARMLSSEVAQSLKSYDIFQTLGSGSLSVTAMFDCWGKVNTSFHGLGEDDTASTGPRYLRGYYLLGGGTEPRYLRGYYLLGGGMDQCHMEITPEHTMTPQHNGEIVGQRYSRQGPAKIVNLPGKYINNTGLKYTAKKYRFIGDISALT